jgi:hypothetical protein
MGLVHLCTEHLRSAVQHAFVEHSANMAMARHATATGTTDLGDAANGLRIVLGNCVANFPFADIQTMADHPMGFGVNGVLDESLLTEVHGKTLNGGNRAGS